MLEENRDILAALRDALIERDELVGDEILEVIDQALARPHRSLTASARRSREARSRLVRHDRARVIVDGARTPIGKFHGSLAGFSACSSGGIAIRAALERTGVPARPGRLRDHGPRAPGRARARSPPRQAAVAGGHPEGVPAITINKVCLSGTSADRDGRPDDPGGRARRRRRGRHGVHDERAVRPAEGARGRAPGRRRAARLHDPRRTVVRVRRPAHGRGHRRDQRRARHHPRGPGRVGRALPCPRARRLGRTAHWPRRSCRSTIPQRKGDPVLVQPRRGDPSRHHAGGAGGAPARVLARRDRHRRQRLADLRRRRRRGRHESRSGGGARRCEPLAEIVAYGMSRRSLPVAADRAGARDGERPEEGGADRRRPRTPRGQRGVRGGRRCTRRGCSACPRSSST